MSVVVEPDDLLDFDAVSRYSQSHRVKLVNTLVKQGKEVEDPEQQKILLKALEGMDKTVVSKRRLGIEEEAQKSASDQQRDTAELLRNIQASMFQTPPGTVVNRPPPTLSDQTPPPTLVQDEVAIGTMSLNYENFIQNIPKA